ncbi:hypothetical protein LINGRAHAP2_LOCUS33939, partial [Linum grandiflorum]
WYVVFSLWSPSSVQQRVYDGSGYSLLQLLQEKILAVSIMSIPLKTSIHGNKLKSHLVSLLLWLLWFKVVAMLYRIMETYTNLGGYDNSSLG